MARQPRFIEDDEPMSTPRRGHRDRSARFESDDNTESSGESVKGYADDAENEAPEDFGKRRGKKVALLIVALLLGFAIIGAGVYALVHFVFMPPEESAPAVTETEAPTMPAEPTLSTLPTDAPTEAPTEPDYAAMAESYMKDMSDYEKLCQLFIVTPEGLTAPLDESGGDGAVTIAGEMTKQSLEEYPVGGIIYTTDNLVDTEQTKKMIENSQNYASTPLFIAVDEEGGDVARVAYKLGTKEFKPMFEYKDEGATVAHDNAEVIASNIRALGFNMDNAPVADVFSNPDNTVIGTRAYSDDFTQAAELVKSAVQGFKDGGVITVLKHFPGHGGTEEDSHDGLAYVSATVDDLKKNELLPFKAGIEADADMVMVGHLVVDDLDPNIPATLSSKVIPELLRDHLSYDGIVITDSMKMGAMQDFSYDTIVRGLFAADIDIILDPDDLEAYIDAIETAIDNGYITQEQIDAKVRKILALKFKQGVMKPTIVDPVPAPASENPIAPAMPTEEPSVAA